MDIENSESYFKLQFEQHYNQMYSYALGVLHNTGQAEEIVQETFLIAWTKCEQFIQSPNPGGWLMNALKYAIKNFFRQSQSNIPPLLPLEEAIYVEDKDSQPENELFEKELFEMCRKILSESDCFILHKVIFEGYTCVETASMIGCRKNTCQKKLQRIISRLKASDDLKQLSFE